MDEWRECRLGDIGTVVGGATPSRERADYWDGPIPWLTPGEITGSREKYVSETQDGISILGLAASGAKLLSAGSLLITSRASIGSCALAGKPLATNQGFTNLTPGTDIDPSFLFHLGLTLGREMTRRASGTTFLEISGREFGRIVVRLPSLEEQRRIAEILDTIDETIQATERVIAKLRSAHEALQQQLVPQRARDGVRETRLGALIDPERPIVYGILMPGEHVIGGVPVIKVKDIKDGRIANKRALLHTSQLIDRQYSRSRVRKGDILFTIRGSVGRTAVVLEAHDGANITQDTARIAVTSVNRSYLVAAMATERVTRFIDVHTIGQAVKGVNLRELRRTPILLIGRDEQEIAGAVLDDSIASISVECGRLEKLRLLRTGLSADLLSGRVRTVAA